MKTPLQTLLILSLAGLIATAATPDYVEGEVLILYKQAVSTKSLSAAVDTLGQTRKTFARLSSRAGKKMQLIHDNNRSTAELVAMLQTNANVEAVSPNYRKRIFAPVRTPNDALLTSQWALHNTGQTVSGTTGTADADIDFTDARRLMMDHPPEAVIAVIDTGVDYNHLDLQNTMWVNTNEVPGNGLDDDGNGYIDDIYGYDFAGDIYTDPITESTNANDGADSDPMDILNHGTHVAGIAAAISDNSRGIAGVGNLKVMALKTSDDGEYLTDGASIAAAEYILEMKTRGVNIVAANASYGGSGFNALEKLSIEQLRDAGIIFCAAAGNETTDNDSTPSYPANYAVDNIISIAATDSSDNLASYSNYGQTSVDVAAPGSLILSSFPPHIGSAASAKQGAQTFSAAGMTFAGMTDSNGISGVLYDCGLGYPSDFPSGVAGNVALIERGELYFTQKIANAMDAGAAAAMTYNRLGETDEVQGTLMRPNGWIPSVGITRTDGLTLLSATGQSVTVINRQDESTSYEYLNGTSMATPVATGAIGVLAQHFPDDTVAERIVRLLNNADAVAGLATACVTGGRLNLQKSLDSDSDDLPDWWELLYAEDLTVMNGISNLDGDSASDLDEYRTGTEPDQPASQWTVAMENSAATSGVFQLSWASQAGLSYRVLASDDLQNGSFEIIGENLDATPPFNAWEPAATNLPARFFKIEFIWD